VSGPLKKTGRVRLKGAAYTKFRNDVLTRDGWACRRCGSSQNLQVHHHPYKRSKVRIDEPWNAITLCYACHELIERHKVDIIGTDCNELVRFRQRTMDEQSVG
jgi:hypothetical protein